MTIAAAPRSPTKVRSTQSQTVEMRARTRSPGLSWGSGGADIRHDQLDQLRRHMRVAGYLCLLGQHLGANLVGLVLADVDHRHALLRQVVAARLLRLRGVGAVGPDIVGPELGDRLLQFGIELGPEI